MPFAPEIGEKIEKFLRKEGYGLIAGIDEAGRGPLAGPVVVCALMLPEDHNISGITDSKQIGEREREKLAKEIRKKAIAYSICRADNSAIDRVNIRRATLSAMKRAALNLLRKTDVRPDLFLVDGRDTLSLPVECRAVIKGDLISENIGAASILAKVYRDNLMKRLDKKFPQYGFATHKGYGTESHYEAIKKFGICEIHRKSFRLFR
ncbi:MAG: ribonuclease HII [Deltaproteobacteria bacterium]|nr:ribonuclease HII [Deltaproteobacteria bacterium]